MKKTQTIAQAGAVELTVKALETLEHKGYKYVQVRALTPDKHFDYVEPNHMLLVPMKELPTDPALKDIYEPIGSELLKQWARDVNDTTQVFIAKKN
ncbi:MAG: hypothetical protein JNM68_14915 [Dinghuibacter sp.]|nr:hypothetical protein [Dinghuibacter sp.]